MKEAPDSPSSTSGTAPKSLVEGEMNVDVEESAIANLSEPETVFEGQFAKLERQVLELIELTTQLSRENGALRTQQRNWTAERAKLIEKNELAKSRVESMITRLKALEHD